MIAVALALLLAWAFVVYAVTRRGRTVPPIRSPRPTAPAAGTGASSRREAGDMAERCERCGGAAFSIWRKPGTHLLLPLCGTHNVEHRVALSTQGWVLRVLAKA